MSTSYALAFVPALTFAVGCVDEHHAHVEDPHHDVHYEEHHHDEHHDPIVVQRALPPAPSQPPPNATGPGRWVWDPQRSQYLWVQP